MNVKRSLTAAAAIIAVLSTTTTAAQAADSDGPVMRGCSTSPLGGSGGAEIHNWYSPSATINVKLDLLDNAADGRYAAIRFVVEGLDESWKFSRWNKVSGYGKYKTGWGKFKYNRGIDKAGVEVATFKGNRMLSECMDVRGPLD
ncbi:hypothetical protein BX264_2000 [Streptomyces sp. 2333.5]|uniref:hypothetical protein n=1 Tax=Streptomyces TaxID=1883 RepID=UPI0008995736|nr:MULTISPECIES: hypothetical protein [unclassified Streptomyces]PJJ01688.1 hypothetical protein BX264_2000 [Streptomyces sp. 2333.5]SED54538.1 hypothetical protein SAMN05428942_2014 [Streptomyces sp. 2112.2]